MEKKIDFKKVLKKVEKTVAGFCGVVESPKIMWDTNNRIIYLIGGSWQARDEVEEVLGVMGLVDTISNSPTAKEITIR